jgi:hypothetical protein
MMALPAAAHAAVLRETKAARNAHARSRRLSRTQAERWCAEVGAEVQRFDHHGEWRWTIRVPGFHPVTSDTLERAVRTLDATISWWLEGRATHGPTGASLARYRALREAG